MIPVHRNPTPLPKHLPKGVKLVYQPEPLGGFTSDRNPYKKGTVEWVAFERHREENWEPSTSISIPKPQNRFGLDN